MIERHRGIASLLLTCCALVAQVGRVARDGWPAGAHRLSGHALPVQHGEVATLDAPSEGGGDAGPLPLLVQGDACHPVPARPDQLLTHVPVHLALVGRLDPSTVAHGQDAQRAVHSPQGVLGPLEVGDVLIHDDAAVYLAILTDQRHVERPERASKIFDRPNRGLAPQCAVVPSALPAERPGLEHFIHSLSFHAVPRQPHRSEPSAVDQRIPELSIVQHHHATGEVPGQFAVSLLGAPQALHHLLLFRDVLYEPDAEHQPPMVVAHGGTGHPGPDDLAALGEEPPLHGVGVPTAVDQLQVHPPLGLSLLGDRELREALSSHLLHAVPH